MTVALDRIVKEDKKGEGLYDHSAEGSDDMPVSFDNFLPQEDSVLTRYPGAH